ncbi:SPNS3 [Cordylochernes scorpioides]|uniref:SPNS3 n=1 Tax=Cordylochernes scorpioides TaxID=51811 RepID=A0ABY6K1L3_9ARAC|nr:SPNS3 [Cordylochernes scorpioides]
MMAWIRRFINNLRSSTKVKGELSVKEIDEAELALLKLVQAECLPSHSIPGLKVCEVEGILRVKTKLIYSSDEFGFRLPVFEVVGIDLAGPLYLKDQTKTWVVLFTCAVYRCVHLELVISLSTEDFLMALERFIKRRGRPSTIFSDNGTNFVGANNFFKQIDWERVSNDGKVKRIGWKFIPPTAAWWEAVMNGRPMTYVSDDPNDLVTISPSMFLQEQTDVECQNMGSNPTTQKLRYLSKLRDELKSRFRKEYLSLLVQRNRRIYNPKLQAGDVVLVGMDNKKRNFWPLAVIEEILFGRDGVNRLVKGPTPGIRRSCVCTHVRVGSKGVCFHVRNGLKLQAKGLCLVDHCLVLRGLPDKVSDESESGVLEEVRGYYSLDDSLAGLIQTLFVVSYMITAPIFGYLGDRYNRTYIIAAGISFWSVTTLLGSFIPRDKFGWFLFLRAMVGVGEASYSTIAPTIIADLFSEAHRSFGLAFFYFAIPLGSGSGYMVGSSVAKALGGWQWGLRVTPGLGILSVVAALLLLVHPQRGHAEGAQAQNATSLTHDLKALAHKDKAMIIMWAGLPQELLGSIFSYLSYNDRVAAARVCSQWSCAFHHPDLWHTLDFECQGRVFSRDERRALKIAERFGKYVKALTVSYHKVNFKGRQMFQKHLCQLFQRLSEQKCRLKAFKMTQLFFHHHWRNISNRKILVDRTRRFLRQQTRLETVDLSKMDFNVKDGLRVLEALADSCGPRLRELYLKDFFHNHQPIYRHKTMLTFSNLLKVSLNHSVLSSKLCLGLGTKLVHLTIKCRRHDFFPIELTGTSESCHPSCPSVPLNYWSGYLSEEGEDNAELIDYVRYLRDNFANSLGETFSVLLVCVA